MKKSIPLILLIALSISSCGKSDTATKNVDQSNNDQLLARISELESENNQLKKELDQYKGVSEETTPAEDQQVEQAASSDNKLIGGEEKGAGKVELQNASGNGNHITVIAGNDPYMLQIGILFEDAELNGSEPTNIYVDAEKNDVAQVSKENMYASNITLEGPQLEKGMHNVEVIQEINGQQTFYRLLTYEVK